MRGLPSDKDVLRVVVQITSVETIDVTEETEHMNQDKQTQIEAVQTALDAYQEALTKPSRDRFEVVTDLLADLRHLLHYEGIDPDRVFSTAEMHHQAEQEQGYEGWTNHATWCVNLWLVNDDATHPYWTEEAARHRDEAAQQSQVLSGIWSEANAACYYLADQLREEVEEASPLVDQGSIYSDLLSAALGEVDWNEIAEALLEELDE